MSVESILGPPWRGHSPAVLQPRRRGHLGFCLESTGAYGEALATALADAGRHVSVVNPARVKYAGLMRGQGNKTDRADARLIAEYAHRERPAPWPPPRPEVRALQALSRRRDDLRWLAAGEKTRLAAPGLTAAVRKSLARAVAFPEREAGRLQEQADAPADSLGVVPSYPGR